jgi:membrane-associated PAP2 superfamily phosphatase
MSRPNDPPHDPKTNMLTLIRVMEWSLHLALGVLATLIGSIREFGEDHRLTFNLWSVLAPVIVVALNRLFWNRTRRRVEAEDFTPKKPESRR